ADYRERTTSFESIAAASIATPLLNLTADGDPEQVRSRNITAGFFSTLGIQPLLGREFRIEDEVWKGPAVAILSYGLWQRGKAPKRQSSASASRLMACPTQSSASCRRSSISSAQLTSSRRSNTNPSPACGAREF